MLYQYQVRYGDAEPLFKRALSIQEKTLGPDCITVAATLNSLAVLYQNKANYTEAESLFKRALGIRKKALGNDHSDVGQSLYNLASFYDNQGRYVEAEPLYRQAFDNIFDQFQSTFTYMTERERLGFLDRINTTGSFPAFFSFVHRFHGADPALAGSMYNLLLWEKGLVAGSVENMRRQVEASGDPDALNLFTQLADKRRQIAALLRLNPSDLDLWRKQVDELQAGANDIERNLVARSSALAEKKKLDRATWQQVRDALQPGDAAVEFVNFRFFDKKWTEVSYYVALVVTRETKNQPEYIFLGDDREIEGSAVVPFLRSVQTRPFVDEQEANLAGAHVYGVIWKPLEKALAGKTRIYLSPDGTLYEVPFGVIPSPDGKLQIEKYDLRLLSSTRDIFLSAPQKVGATALLVGDPVFNVSEEQQRVAMKELTLLEQEAPVQMAILSPNDVSRDPGKGFPLQRLPGTGDEVNAIADLMRERGWKSDLYTKERALKRVVERTDSPKVVHLATHGFFLPDQQIKSYRTDLGHTQPSRLEDPMLRSGLYFAGADRTLAGKPTPEDLDNGILTAAEAGSLNLRGAELVVLSACNTGLGDVKNGEGVFGLRRALQEAGAQSVLMSLWPVPDNHTLELMKRFYSNWLSGMEIHESLKEAQLEMRKRVRMNHEGRDLPYYWGAFVLVGR